MNYLIRNQWSVKEIKRYESAREECSCSGWLEGKKAKCRAVIMWRTCVSRDSKRISWKNKSERMFFLQWRLRQAKRGYARWTFKVRFWELCPEKPHFMVLSTCMLWAECLCACAFQSTKAIWFILRCVIRISIPNLIVESGMWRMEIFIVLLNNPEKVQKYKRNSKFL